MLYKTTRNAELETTFLLNQIQSHKKAQLILQLTSLRSEFSFFSELVEPAVGSNSKRLKLRTVELALAEIAFVEIAWNKFS